MAPGAMAFAELSRLIVFPTEIDDSSVVKAADFSRVQRQTVRSRDSPGSVDVDRRITQERKRLHRSEVLERDAGEDQSSVLRRLITVWQLDANWPLSRLTAEPGEKPRGGTQTTWTMLNPDVTLAPLALHLLQ